MKIIVLLFVMICSLSAQEVSQIVVTGTGTVNFIPDVVHVNYNIEMKGEAITPIVAEVNKKAAVFKKFCFDNGVKESSYSDYRMSINPDRSIKKIAGNNYNVVRTISFMLQDTDKLDVIVEKAAEMEFTGYNNISFVPSSTKGYELEAYEKAYEDAFAKAERIAKKAGMKLGKVIHITENSASVYPAPRVMAASVNTFSAGEQSISETLTVTIEVK